MEEESIHVIRESTRNLLKLNRQHHRDEVSDINRSINEMRITSETITNIAQKLKTKSRLSATNLHTLKNGLIDDPKNKSKVLSTPGALRGLVRELTGHEAKKQCAAAGCLCNLALADGKTCNTIAKASGSYLITALDSLTVEFVVTCAWTLGNLAGSCGRVSDLLVSQGALSKLCDLLQSNEDVQDAALYALVHFAHQLKDQLRMEHLKRILEELTKIQLTRSSSQLLFILSCHRDFPESTTIDLTKKVVTDWLKTLETHSIMCKIKMGNNFCCKLVYLIRILSNMDMCKIYDSVLENVKDNNVTKNIFIILNERNDTFLCDSLLWLLGNLYVYNSDHVFFYNLLHSK